MLATKRISDTPIPDPPAAASTRIEAVVLAFNESARLPACLASLAWADDVYVIDGYSTDDTVAVARASGARVVQSDLLGPSKPGGFSNQRNFALDQITAEWVLFVDADERVTPELAESIRKVIGGWSAGQPVAYRMRRREHFFGVYSPYTHGEAWMTRLVRRADVRWDGRAVHEGLLFDGPVGDLTGQLLHYSKDTLSHYVRTMDRYTSLEGQEAFAFQPVPPATPWRPMTRAFLYRYIHMGSYREGTFGLLMSLMFSFYSYLSWAKHWELAKDAGRIPGQTRGGRLVSAVCRPLAIVWHGFGRARIVVPRRLGHRRAR